MTNAPPIPAMILAAGRGNRMRPLTDAVPKPLLPLFGKPLMQFTLEALARGGFTRVVVNTAWLGEQIGDRFGETPTIAQRRMRIRYSHEGRDFGAALETAGGIARALPLLGDLFWVTAGDVHAPDFPFSQAAVDRFAASGRLAHLWLVPNPPQHPEGDFGLSPDGLALNRPEPGAPSYTFSTIALYRAELFDELPFGNLHGEKAALAPLLRRAIGRQRVGAELFEGAWTDVGTPERLHELGKRA